MQKDDIDRLFKNFPDTVYITGGMSGIGHYLAQTLVAYGCNLAIFDLDCDPSVLDTVVEKRQSPAQRVECFELDIRDPEMTMAVINQAVDVVGRPNLMIHCAGILETAPFQQLSYQSFQRVIDVNLMGSRNIAAASITHLTTGGHLVLFASLAGIVGTYTQAAYAASKFGVVGLAEVLRLELAQDEIDVSVVCPGEIVTPLLERERQVGSQTTQKLNAIAGVLTVEKAGNSILRGIARRQFMITPGYRALFVREFARKASGLFRWLSDVKFRQVRRSHR